MRQYSEISTESKEAIKKYVKQVATENSAVRVGEMVREKFDVIISERTVRYMCQRIRETLSEIGDELEGAIEELNKEDKPKYEIVSNEKNELCYQMNVRNNIFTIPVEQIDKIFHMFSEHGDDMSAQEVQNEFNLSPQAWVAIKGKLNLYKTSHVISPYTLENSSGKEVDAIIESATKSHIDSYRKKFIKTHELQFKAQAIDAIKFKANFEYQCELAQQAIEKHIPLEMDFKTNPIENDNEAHFVLSDIHLGKLDSNGILARLKAMYLKIQENPARVIHITCLGDLVETLAQGGMHPGQVEYGLDPTFGYGFETIIKTVDIFEQWLKAISATGKKVYFRGITGNHGRMTSKKEDDHWRTGELVIYEMIKKGLSQLDIDVVYFKEFINTFVADNIEYIIYHGDGFLDKQKPEQIIVAHAQTGLYKVLMSGDKHSIKLAEGMKYTWVKSPCLASVGMYDRDNNLHSEPGYLQIERNEYNTADISVKRLKK